MSCEVVFFFFFFSSRRRHTRWNCDWSSDVCSSDLTFTGSYHEVAAAPANVAPLATLVDKLGAATKPVPDTLDPAILTRWLFGAICAALVLEWTSRRTRGVK